MEEIRFIGKGLLRPESVLTTEAGDIFASHNGYGVMRFCPDGRQFLLHGPAKHDGIPIVPNGIALRKDGSFLVANISDAGGLLELDADGMRMFNDCAAGLVSSPVNFVMIDAMDKIWVTISSTLSPQSLAYRRDVKNGYVGVIESGRLKVLLEGLHYTNEIRTDYENGWLFISETLGQKVSRVRLGESGVYGHPETFAQLPRGAFVDGIELDGVGGLYAACIVSNELFHISACGDLTVIAGERVPEWIDEVESALDRGEMGRSHFDTAPTRTLRNIASLAFFGPKRDQIVCGNLLGDSLPVVKATNPGPAPSNWKTMVPLWGTEFSGR